MIAYHVVCHDCGFEAVTRSETVSPKPQRRARRGAEIHREAFGHDVEAANIDPGYPLQFREAGHGVTIAGPEPGAYQEAMLSFRDGGAR